MKALGVVVKKEELKKMITDVDADGSGSVEVSTPPLAPHQRMRPSLSQPVLT